MVGMRVLLLALMWTLLKAQMPLAEALGLEIPTHQEMGRALVTAPDPPGEEDTEHDKLWDDGLR